MSWLGDAIGTVGNALGSVASGVGGFLADTASGGAITDARSVREANETNVALAREQMAFQERMSNSAYQRAMDDMGKAGLNPMLAFSQGGASTPQGAMGHVDPANDAPGKVFSRVGEKALQAMKFNADIHQTQSSTRLNDQNADVGKSTIYKNEASADLDKDRAFNVVQERKNARVTEDILKERQRSAAAEADEAEISRDISKARRAQDLQYAPADAHLERLEQAIGAVTNGAQVMKYRRPPVPPPRGPKTYKSKQYDIRPGTGEILKERHYESTEE